ncbi:hypothetical protein [Anaerococcus sp. mt242]|uniref:hypothetical protein n=1 Tax=unclassified Anaerococcus TaxID=2614126 RepID=UPI0019330508|nr:hypothetical protein [Anaerococcus sp. mt242]MBM0046523.1 hypothetical protein [Anaerococcus sp. mt242]
MDQISLLKNLIWPVLLDIGFISLLDFILDRKKSSRNIAIIFLAFGFGVFAYFIYFSIGYLFLQVYLFMFLLSLSLVILALKKRIDAFTIIGIILMVVMLILLLRYTLIE